MLNLRKPSLQIGLTILTFCGLAFNAGYFSTAFASTPNSISYPEITNSSALTFETLSTDSIQVAQELQSRPQKNCTSRSRGSRC